MQEGKAKPIQSVQRAADIIKCFGNTTEALSLTEISTRLGLHKSTVYGIMATLCATGFLLKSGSSYRIGPLFTRFSGDARPVGDLLYFALKDTMHEIADTFVLSCDLYLFDAAALRFSSKYHALPNNVQYAISVQTPSRECFHCCASGKLALSQMSEEALLSFRAAHPQKSFSVFTLTEAEDLDAALAQVRREGYACESEELSEGISAIAVPLQDASGALIATLSVTGTAYRIAKYKAELIRALKQAAAGSCSALGR